MKDFKVEVPKGYEIDKEKSTFECIKFKPISKAKITWNTYKFGVEVHSGDFHFVILDRPLCSTSWHNAQYLANIQGGYVPSKEDLQVVLDNLDEIKNVWNMHSSREFPSYCWSFSNVDSDFAWVVNFTYRYFIGDSNKDLNYYVVPFCEV